MARPTRISIDLNAIKANLAHVRHLAPSSKVLGIVKANAYGHGAVAVARAIAPLVDTIAVSCMEEAQALRMEGVKSPLLLLEGAFTQAEWRDIAGQGMIAMIHSDYQWQWLQELAMPTPVMAWLKVDTGMHRLGLSLEQASEMMARMRSSGLIHDQLVLASHFASADEPDNPLNQQQYHRFSELHRKHPELLASLANSAAIMADPKYHLDWVRPGLMLYGVSPFGCEEVDKILRPAMTLSSQIIALREVKKGEFVGYGNRWCAAKPSLIATVAIGYGDGYPIAAKDGTPALVNGKEAYLAGRVSMDMLTLDVSHIHNVKIGDEVELWGKRLSVNRVARYANTIGYELLTRLPSRVQRDYVD